MKHYKLSIILSSIIFFLCNGNAMVMETPSTQQLMQKNYLRKALLEKFVATQKKDLITFVNLPAETQTDASQHAPSEPQKGETFLTHHKYELIGTSSGHLLIVNESNKSFEKIKVHRNNVSSLTAKDDIVATGSNACNIIRRWNIQTFKMHDAITCNAPIIFMQNIDNLFFIIDAHGNISILDWDSTIQLCHIETYAHPILNTLLDKNDGFLIIITEKACAIVKINLLVKIDALIYSLNEQQTALLFEIITTNIQAKDYTKLLNDAKIPYVIKELTENFIKI